MLFALAHKRNHKDVNSKWRCSSVPTQMPFWHENELMVIFKRDFNGKQCKTIDGELSLCLIVRCALEERKNWKTIDKHEIRLWCQRFHEQKCVAAAASIFLHALSHGWISAVCCARMEIDIFEIHSCALLLWSARLVAKRGRERGI